MRSRLLILSTFCILTFSSRGQRIVNKYYFKFPKIYSLDTINRRSPYKILLSIDSPLDSATQFSEMPSNGPIPRKAKFFFTPDVMGIAEVDKAIRYNVLNAVVAGDSLLFVKNQLYKSNNGQPSDFKKYKARRSELYETTAILNRKKIKKSDRYYFGFINQENRRYIVVLFDPKKIKYRMMGDLKWVDFCDPFVIELDTGRVWFAYGLMPDPE